MEKRILDTENSIKEVENSIQFVSEKFDEIAVERNNDALKLKNIDKSFHDIRQENDETRRAILEIKQSNAGLKDDLVVSKMNDCEIPEKNVY
ncbi:hypothetical protein DPMN_156954 [Dreissena polymorpha]|uniref:Uncharacterized protein n=1 Tax=Dreissena polymorpha TaxID=45954 RepID=A0A9D4FWK8_DREPO|nr:hypothetical protein DPMN_156954 [Dreissena polymorpha]